MSDSVCRVSVHASHHSGVSAVDVALPAGAEVAVLIPEIVDMVGVLDGVSPSGWQLSRIGGPPLDASISLRENGIHDGELLVLVRDEPFGPPVAHNRPLLRADPADRFRPLAAVTALWVSGVGVLTVASAGLLRDSGGRALTVALLIAAIGSIAIATRHRRPEPLVRTTVGVIAVLLAAAAGALAVPGGPAAPNLLLAVAGGGSAAVVMVRVTAAHPIPMAAVAVFAAVVAGPVTAAAFRPVSGEVVGALIALTGMVVLTGAARLSVTLAGLSPALPAAGTEDHDECSPADDALVRGNAILTGLIIGAAAGATLGSALVAASVAFSAPQGQAWPGAAFTAALGAAVGLRARSHIDGLRHAALLFAGTLCVTASFVIIVVSLPGVGALAGAVAIATGLAALNPFGTATASPVARRAVDLVEYAALAALIPLVCWVIGLYGQVRGLTLP